MDQKLEAEIVAKVLKGDRQVYALLVEEYKSPVYNLAYRITGKSLSAVKMRIYRGLEKMKELLKE